MGLITYLRHRSVPAADGRPVFEDGVDVSPGSWPGGPDGVLVLHGFTGSPHSMRDWACHWASLGYAVEMPLLPGHGTSIQDMAARSWREWTEAVDAAYFRLARRTRRVGVVGLSMGGALALHLAARRPVEALSLVNPGVVTPYRITAVAGLLAPVVPSIPGIRNDIARPDVAEGAYARVPVAAAGQMHRLFAAVQRSLPAVRQPVQVFRSAEDHVVPDSSLACLRRRLPRPPEVVALPHSHHVATLDHDAPLIFEESARFFAEHRLRGGPDGEADSPPRRATTPGPRHDSSERTP